MYLTFLSLSSLSLSFSFSFSLSLLPSSHFSFLIPSQLPFGVLSPSGRSSHSVLHGNFLSDSRKASNSLIRGERQGWSSLSPVFLPWAWVPCPELQPPTCNHKEKCKSKDQEHFKGQSTFDIINLLSHFPLLGSLWCEKSKLLFV